MILFSVFERGTYLIYLISTYFLALPSSLSVRGGVGWGGSFVGFSLVPFPLLGDRVQGTAHIWDCFL